MNAGLVIRAATASDVRELHGLFVKHSTTSSTDEKVNRYRDRLDRLVDSWDHRIVVAEIDGQTLGYAAAQDYGPPSGEDRSVARMHDLWVSPEARGRGAGRALFNDVRNWAQNERRIGVLQWQSSQVAADFYERLGLADASGDGTNFELAVHLPQTES